MLVGLSGIVIANNPSAIIGSMYLFLKFTLSFNYNFSKCSWFAAKFFDLLSSNVLFVYSFLMGFLDGFSSFLMGFVPS